MRKTWSNGKTITPVAKVFAQNVCSVFGHSNVTSDNEK
jgi:hypothetical protein